MKKVKPILWLLKGQILTRGRLLYTRLCSGTGDFQNLQLNASPAMASPAMMPTDQEPLRPLS